MVRSPVFNTAERKCPINAIKYISTVKCLMLTTDHLTYITLNEVADIFAANQDK